MDQLPNEMRVTDPLRTMCEVYYLSRKVEYKLEFCRPFIMTANCDVALEYSNYTMDEKHLVDEDEEDVVSKVKDALQLGALAGILADSWQPTLEEARFQFESKMMTMKRDPPTFACRPAMDLFVIAPRCVAADI